MCNLSTLPVFDFHPAIFMYIYNIYSKYIHEHMKTVNDTIEMFHRQQVLTKSIADN